MKRSVSKIFVQLLLIFIAALWAISCTPDVLFQEAEPPGVPSVNSIPVAFQGVYECESDSSLFYAEETIVYRTSVETVLTTIQNVEETENCAIVAGGIFLSDQKECIPFEYIGEDSLKVLITTIDTLFTFNKNEVMKLHQGKLFLNYQNDPNEWTTIVVSEIENGSLKWEIIDIPNRTKVVESITKDYKRSISTSNDTVFIINPTMQEFNKILKGGFMSSREILIPVNIE